MSDKHCDQFTFVKLKKRLHSFGELKFKIATDSMYPLICIGDEIEVFPVDRDFRAFDIIVYWDGEKLMAHYVWHVNNLKIKNQTSLLTRSLKNQYENDLPIPVDNILGFVHNFKLSTFKRILITFKCVLKKCL